MDTIQKHSSTDVLIIGAGPTGLLAALWLAEHGVSTRVIDKLGTRALNGRADGYQVRTKEVYASFGLADTVDQHSPTTNEIAVWAAPEGKLQRVSRSMVFGGDTSRMLTSFIHQGHTEAVLINAIKERGGASIERGTMPLSVAVDDSISDLRDSFPVTVAVHHLMEDQLEPWGVNAFTKLNDGGYRISRGSIDTNMVKEDPRDIVPHVDGPQGSTEMIHAKYVLGADGGHSWLRKQLGINFEGIATTEEWGVVDIWPKTKFPDVRKLCQITSKHGSGLIIPRENGLVRIYVQLDPSDIHRPRSNPDDPVVAQQIIDKANRIFEPYHIDFEYCDWWTIYKVGRRIAEHYGDPSNRIFLAGDAVHTHTPMGGQGMNTSMQDAFNLGWKLAGVIRGQLSPEVLTTYEAERRPIAEGLMEIDAKLTKTFGSHEMPTREDVEDLHEMQRVFGDGTRLTYDPNITISSTTIHGDFASDIKIGQRFGPRFVYNQATGCPKDVLSLLTADGIWRLLIFAGDVTQQDQLHRVNMLGERLETKVLHRFASVKPYRQFLQPILFHGSRVDEIESHDFHRCFFPFDETRGHDYDRIYADVPAVGEHDGSESLHQALGVAQAGCMIVTRPDQIVSFIGRLDDVDNLIDYFDGFIRRV